MQRLVGCLREHQATGASSCTCMLEVGAYMAGKNKKNGAASVVTCIN